MVKEIYEATIHTADLFRKIDDICVVGQPEVIFIIINIIIRWELFVFIQIIKI